MKKYISVLLSVFVFAIGIVQGSNVYADALAEVAKLAKDIARASVIASREKSFDDEIRIDGSQNLKYTDNSKKDSRHKKGQYTAEVGRDQKIRIHYIFKPIPLETLNQSINTKIQNENLKNHKANVTHRESSVTMELTAYKEDEVLKTVKTSSKNQLDTYLDYHVPKEATHLSVNVKMSGILTIIESGKKGSDTNKYSNGSELTVNLKAIDKVVPPPEESGGISLIYLGGGLFVLLIGGAAFYFFGGGGAAGAGAGIWGSSAPAPKPESPAPPPEPEYFNYKDPAGFETLYMKDPETGQWYNYQDYKEGYRVPVNMDKLQEYDAQRRQDVAWNRDQMQKLEERSTGFDKELKQEYQDMLEREKQIQQETKKDLYALERGTFGMSNEERKTFLEDRQAKDQQDVDKWTKRAEAWDTAMTVAETVQTAADIGVDIMATIAAPVGGGLVADAYVVTKNIAGCGMEGLVNKERTLAGGLLEGATKAGVDYAQNHSGAKWQKLLSFVGGEGLKGGIDAGLKGESIVKGTIKGALQGGTKLGVDAVGKKIGDKIAKNSSDSLKHAYEHAGDIRNRIAPQVSKRSAEALKKMNLQKHLANMQKGEHQTLANTITNGVARNLLPKVFG